MAHTIRRVEYFNATVKDEPGQGYKLLSQLAEMGFNLLAFTAVPGGLLQTQLTIFPDDPARLAQTARTAGLPLIGPFPAFLVQGDDELGAFAGIHAKLYQSNVNVYASSGVTDGRGSYGYVLYLRPEEYDRAARALGV
jgi:hypothetical protein